MADTEELRALSRLLDEALGLPPTRRQSWLDTLAGADMRHKATLARLLADADHPSDDPLETPPILRLLRTLSR